MPIEVLIIVCCVVGVLLLFRLMLPTLAVSYANRFLRKHPTVHGTIRKIGISLLVGRFTIKDLRISMTDRASGIDSLIVSVPSIRLDVNVWSLSRKKIFASAVLQRPEVVFANILKKPEAPKTKKEVEDNVTKAPVPSPLKKMIENILPFRVNLQITEGTIRYIDHTDKPQHNIALTNLNLAIHKFSILPIDKTIPASIQATATLFEGDVALDVELQPLEEFLTFDSNLELKSANLTALNDYARAYANIDVNAGTLSVFTEIIAKDGGFKGYIKPVLKDIDIIGAEDKGDSLFKKIWERIVAVAIQGLENNKVDQIATKIEIEGRLDDPHVNVFTAIGGVLRNAFVQAVQPSLENALGLGSVLKSAVSGTASFVKKLFV